MQRLHPYPRHFFNFYVTHGGPFGLFNVRYAISPIWSCWGALYQYRAFFILHCCYTNAPYIFALIKQIFQRNSLHIAFSQFSQKKWNRLQFYKRNPFKNESDQKKGSPKNWNHLQFYKRNPFKFFPFNFTKEIPLKFLRFS